MRDLLVTEVSCRPGCRSMQLLILGEWVSNFSKVSEALAFEEQRFCLLVEVPRARAFNATLATYFIRCFGKTPYPGNTDRNLLTNAICNAFFLLLGSDLHSNLVGNLPACIAAALRRCRMFSDDRPEVADLLKLGHVGPILQESGGHLAIKKFKIPPQGHRETPDVRFNWLFSTMYHGHVFLDQLFECGIVDHVVLIYSRRWPALIYDPADTHPIVLSSISLFHRTGPDSDKVKVTSLHEVVRLRRTSEKPRYLRRKLLSMPRGDKLNSLWSTDSLVHLITYSSSVGRLDVSGSP